MPHQFATTLNSAPTPLDDEHHSMADPTLQAAWRLGRADAMAGPYEGDLFGGHPLHWSQYDAGFAAGRRDKATLDTMHDSDAVRILRACGRD